jgi:hypothetical protein
MKRLVLVLIAAFSLAACDFAMPITNSAGGPTAPTPVVAAPIVNTFTSDTLTVRANTAVLLRWDVTGQTVEASIAPLVGSVAQSGSTSVTVTATTTFTLVARNAGGTVQRTVTITVTP